MRSANPLALPWREVFPLLRRLLLLTGGAAGVLAIVFGVTTALGATLPWVDAMLALLGGLSMLTIMYAGGAVLTWLAFFCVWKLPIRPTSPVEPTTAQHWAFFGAAFGLPCLVHTLRKFGLFASQWAIDQSGMVVLTVVLEIACIIALLVLASRSGLSPLWFVVPYAVSAAATITEAELVSQSGWVKYGAPTLYFIVVAWRGQAFFIAPLRALRPGAFPAASTASPAA